MKKMYIYAFVAFVLFSAAQMSFAQYAETVGLGNEASVPTA